MQAHTLSTCPVPAAATVAYRLAGDPTRYVETAASSLFWGQPADGEPGRIAEYEVLAPLPTTTAW